jgi:glutaredoxin 2
VPQSVGMFAIKGSRTTLVKDDSALGAAMIGADVIPIFI